VRVLGQNLFAQLLDLEKNVGMTHGFIYFSNAKIIKILEM
jgi:hypothetical protein